MTEITGGRHQGTSAIVSPQVFVYYCLLLNCFSLITDTNQQRATMHISLETPAYGRSQPKCCGDLMISVPSLSQFQVRDVTQSELLALSHAGVWGDTEKPHQDMAYLLIALGKTVKGEMVFELAVVWVCPHQVCLSSLDEAVRKLTLLIDIGDNWAYAFMQLNINAQHIPLSSDNHTSAMIDNMLSRGIL